MATRNGAISRRRLLASASAAGARDAAGNALSEPRGGPAAHHPRHPVGRRLGRLRRGVGARRPARAHAGRGRDHRQLSQHHPARRMSTRCRRATSPPRCCSKDCRAGQDIFYRVRVPGSVVAGDRRRAAGRALPHRAGARAIGFVRLVGRHRGQGWGIDEARGGMRTYATMLRNRPDFFIHCGDSIYADCPIGAEQKLPNGEIWRNIVTEEKSKVAETLAEFRGNYKYNLLDANLRAFNAEVPIFAQWDDHEVTNDWWPGCRCDVGDYADSSAAARGARPPRLPRIHADAADRGRGRPHLPQDRLRSAARRVHARHALLSRAERRRGRELRPNAHLLGPAQLAWLKRELAALARDLEGDRRRPADRRRQLRCDRAGRRRRRAAASSRSPSCSRSSSTPACQHGLDHRRHALHRGALLRSEPRGVPGLRRRSGSSCPARSMPAPGRPGELDNTFGPRAVFQNGLQQGAGRQSRALLRPAVLRPCRDRRRDRGDDGDAEGRQRPRAVGNRAGAGHATSHPLIPA